MIKNKYIKNAARTFVLALLFAFLGTENAFSLDWSAQWIWQAQDGPDNTWMSFRKEVNLSAIPDTAIASIGVDSKYWLWINGDLVKFEGGAARGPKPGATWYDEVDLKPYLKTGTNTIAILAWYWGRTTFKGTHIDSQKGGLIFQAQLGNVRVKSDNTWKAKLHPAYDANSGGGNNRIVPYNVHYDANNSLGDWSATAWYTEGYDDSAWAIATEKGGPSTAQWGDLEKSYVTLVDHGLSDYVSLHNGTSFVDLPYTNNTGATITINAKLPFNKQITPYLDVNSAANNTIDIATSNSLNTITAKYITKAGDQQFEAYSWMSGHDVVYEIPDGVTVNALKYRWTGIGNLDGDFECSDPFFERLWWMGRNTIYVCARDNFMDCPDRERSLWIGDVSDQASYLFYTMDEQGRELLRKAIRITINFGIDEAVIAGQAPGFVNELPTQSLQFISQTIWQYYVNTGDKETLEYAYTRVKNYLALWSMDNTKNLIRMKSCTHEKCWDWCDWDSGKTIDKLPIFNALYYYALNSAKKMADVLEKPQADTDWYNARITQIYTGFNENYWTGEYYSSDAPTLQDDRANALAIIAGLADSTKYASIVSQVLEPNHYCSPHFEWMIEEAMCLAGYHSKAMIRMKKRYQAQVENENTTTLNEYFTIGEGTDNHAWNAPNTTLSKYIAGVSPVEAGWAKYRIAPVLTRLSAVKQVVSSVKGEIVVDIKLEDSTYQMDLESPSGSVAIIGIPKASIAATEIKVNEAVVWQNGHFIVNPSYILETGEDADFIWFELNDGMWSVVATGVINIPNYITCTNLNNSDEIDAGDDLVVRAEAGDSTKKVELYVNDVLVRSLTEMPYVWGLDAVEDATLVQMAAGDYTLKLVAIDNVQKSVETSFSIVVNDTLKQMPYDGIIQIPGILQAENYDIGGEGKSYHDSNTSNTGEVYRNDDVDIDLISAGEYNIGWSANGEWLEYTVNVSETADYDIAFVYAAGRTSPAKVGLEFFDESKTLFNNFTLPVTGGWGNYDTVTKESVYLTQGEHILRLNISLSGCNIDKLIFTKTGSTETDIVIVQKNQVSPNPSSTGIFCLSVDSLWGVYSLMGQKIVSGAGSIVDISNFQKGLYLLKTEHRIDRILYN